MKPIHTELGALWRFRKRMYINLSIHQRINVKSNFGIVTGFRENPFNMPCLSRTMKYNS
jgi:hypothetical protein